MDTIDVDAVDAVDAADLRYLADNLDEHDAKMLRAAAVKMERLEAGAAAAVLAEREAWQRATGCASPAAVRDEMATIRRELDGLAAAIRARKP